MTRWFRHYAGMMRDEKLVRAAMKSRQPVERVVWVWGAILESAAEINEAGRYDFDAAEAAYFLRCDEDDVQNVVAALSEMGRLNEGTVAKWSSRQFDSDGSKERQQRYRDRQRASRDGAVTPPETEADTEPEIQPAPPLPEPEGARVSFEDVKEAFPRNPSSSDEEARQAWDRTKPGDRALILEAAQRRSRWFAQDCEERGRSLEEGERYEPHLAKWLRGAWRDSLKLPLKGELDPSLVVVKVGTPEFAALQRAAGPKPLRVGEHGTRTVRKADLESAMRGAA